MTDLETSSPRKRAGVSMLLCASAVLLVGCASVSKEECLTGNWDEIGYRDGTNGRTQDYIQRHVKACSRVDVVPNMSVWNAARLRGVPVYCVPERAYTEGRSGRDVSPVCAPDVMPALLAANDKGQRYYRIGQEIHDLEEKVDRLEDQQIEAEDDRKKFVIGVRIRNLESRIRRLEALRHNFDSL